MIRPWLAAVVAVMASALTACGGGSETPSSPVKRDSAEADASFGENGVAVVSFGPGYAEANDLLVDAGGRPVVVGTGPGDTGRLLRLRPDGALDSEFGDGGVVTTALDRPVRAVAFTSDGAIIIAGEHQSGFAVARYRDDGSLDTTFGANGISVVGFEGSRGTANAVAVDAEGRITAGGAVVDPTDLTTGGLGLVRYTADGAPDTAFGQGGRVYATTAPPVYTPNSMAVDERGDIAVGAAMERSAPGQPANADAVLARYTSGGTSDPAFGDGGVVVVDLGSPFDGLNGVLLVGPERIIATGSANPEGRGVQATLIGRDASTGGAAAGFGVGGVVGAAIPPLSEAFAAVTRPDGALLVLGRVADDAIRSDTDWEWALAAFGADGTPDRAFGRGGVLRSPVGKKANALATALDGSVVAAGCTCPSPPRGRGGPESDSSFVVVRYLVGG